MSARGSTPIRLQATGWIETPSMAREGFTPPTPDRPVAWVLELLPGSHHVQMRLIDSGAYRELPPSPELEARRRAHTVQGASCSLEDARVVPGEERPEARAHYEVRSRTLRRRVFVYLPQE